MYATKLSVIRRVRIPTITTTAATRTLPRPIPRNSLQLHDDKYTKSSFSSISKGQDLLADSLAHGSKRKIILDSFYPGVGFDVIGMIEYNRSHRDGEQERKIRHNNHEHKHNDDNSVPIPGMKIRRQKDHNDNPNNNNNNDFNIDNYDNEEEQTLLMNSSIIAFPHSCFLWNNISSAKDVTLESLSMVQLLQPSVEFLFIGCDQPLPPRELNRIKKSLKEKSNIVVDQMDVMNAMGTFNILNGEDRRVAVALVVSANSSS
jgi:uncharacterized protein